ncbi:hypothetical protein HMPREF1486_04694 [Streptomyces sp. HPH0547]|nr:hypothetical protein HMPREF1486_04694 [Streptomyces sp. HPH0547]GHJ24391.1 hypothetical protein TPA0909_60050 [Streptomyces albus]
MRRAGTDNPGMRNGPRSQAERDALTVEIGYALLSAGLLAALVFAAIASPAVVWELPSRAVHALLLAGAVTAGLLAVVRIVRVLRRYARREGRAREA